MKLKVFYMILVISILLNIALINNYINHQTETDVIGMTNNFEGFKRDLLGGEYYLKEAISTEHPIAFYHNIFLANDRLTRGHFEIKGMTNDIAQEYSTDINALRYKLFDIYHGLGVVQGDMISNEFKVITDENRTRVEGILKEVKELNEVLKEMTLNKEDLTKLNDYLYNK